MAIGVKHEMSARFIGALPMRSLSETMKPAGDLFHALVSRETALVSARFTFRFRPFFSLIAAFLKAF